MTDDPDHPHDSLLVLFGSIGLLLAAGCGPSDAELAARSQGREAVEQVRTQLDDADDAFRQAVEAFSDGDARPCSPGDVRAAPGPTGQAPGNYAEYRRDELERIQLPLTRTLRSELHSAAELLDDEDETFRWENGARLATAARDTLGSTTGYDLILITDLTRPEAGAETFDSDRMTGHLFGWDTESRQIVCAGVFDADPPGSVFVGADSATTDLLRTVTYEVRKVAFEAAGFGEIEPTRYGAPSIW